MKIHHSKAFISLFMVCSFVLLAACSSQESSSESQANTDNKEDVPQAAKDIEGILKEGPGKFAGEKYNEEKIKKLLDEWPKDISAEEAYSRMVQLVAEDYQPHVKTYDSIDPNIQLSRKKPGERDTPEGKQAKELNVSI